MRRWVENIKNPQVAITGVLCAIFFVFFMFKAVGALTTKQETRPYEVAPNPVLVTSSEPSIVEDRFLRPIPDDADLDAAYALADRLQPVVIGSGDPNTVTTDVAINRRETFATAVAEFRTAVAAATYTRVDKDKPVVTVQGFEDGEGGTITVVARYRNEEEQVKASWLITVRSVAALSAPVAPTPATPPAAEPQTSAPTEAPTTSAPGIAPAAAKTAPVAATPPGVQTGANQYVVTDVTFSFSGA